MNLVSVQLSTTCPHLALVLGSQRVDELLHAERFPHQHRDPLWTETHSCRWQEVTWQTGSEQSYRLLPCRFGGCRASCLAERHSDLRTSHRKNDSGPHHMTTYSFSSSFTHIMSSVNHVTWWLTHMPQWQDDGMERALRYEPTHTWNTDQSRPEPKSPHHIRLWQTDALFVTLTPF